MSMQHFLSWNQEDHEGFDTEIIGSRRRPRWTTPPTPEAIAEASTSAVDRNAVLPVNGESDPVQGMEREPRSTTPKKEDVRPVHFRSHLAHTSKVSF